MCKCGVAGGTGAKTQGYLDHALAAEPTSFVPAIVILARLADPAALCVAVKPQSALARAAAALILAAGRRPSGVGRARQPKAPLAGHVLTESARRTSPSVLSTSGRRMPLLLCCRLCRSTSLLLSCVRSPSPGAVGNVLAAAHAPRVNLHTPTACESRACTRVHRSF